MEEAETPRRAPSLFTCYNSNERRYWKSHAVIHSPKEGFIEIPLGPMSHLMVKWCDGEIDDVAGDDKRDFLDSIERLNWMRDNCRFAWFAIQTNGYGEVSAYMTNKNDHMRFKLSF